MKDIKIDRFMIIKKLTYECDFIVIIFPCSLGLLLNNLNFSKSLKHDLHVRVCEMLLVKKYCRYIQISIWE